MQQQRRQVSLGQMRPQLLAVAMLFTCHSTSLAQVLLLRKAENYECKQTSLAMNASRCLAIRGVLSLFGARPFGGSVARPQAVRLCLWHRGQATAVVAWLDLAELIEEARGGGRRGRGPGGQRRQPDAAGNWPCGKCGAFKPVDAFSVNSTAKSGMQSYCKECDRKVACNFHRTLRGNAFTCVSNARSSALRRGHTCMLTYEDVLDMLMRQRGLCAYSDVPMEYRMPNSHWRMSLERLNNGLGYHRDNCVLIAG